MMSPTMMKVIVSSIISVSETPLTTQSNISDVNSITLRYKATRF
jgi:hypothetical protein